MTANPQSDDIHGIAMTEEAFERMISAESPYRKGDWAAYYCDILSFLRLSTS